MKQSTDIRLYEKIERNFQKQSEMKFMERMKQMREEKKNHKIDFDSIREHEQMMREQSEKRRQEEEIRMRKEAKINIKITNILESFKDKFMPVDSTDLKKSLRIKMIRKQHDFAEQVA